MTVPRLHPDGRREPQVSGSYARAVARTRAELMGCVALGVLGLGLLVAALVTRRWGLGLGGLLVLASLVAGLRSRPLRLAFTVGRSEEHAVVFTFDKFWGTLSVTVDGRSVVRDLRTLSVSLTKTYAFDVGLDEVHHVRIDKHRAAALAGFRPQPVRAYVDDALVAEGVA